MFCVPDAVSKYAFFGPWLTRRVFVLQGKVMPVTGFLHQSEIRNPYALEGSGRAKSCEVEVKKGIHLTAYVKDVFPNAGRLTLSLDPEINKDKVRSRCCWLITPRTVGLEGGVRLSDCRRGRRCVLRGAMPQVSCAKQAGRVTTVSLTNTSCSAWY